MKKGNGKAGNRVGTRENVKVLRREQLIEATMKTIARRGFARTTMAEVAKTAGMSQGIVNFYFDTKEALLYETLVHLAEEYEGVLQRGLARAGDDPVAGINAMILADLGPEACTSTKCAVWLAFWAESRGNPKYRQLCRKLDGTYHHVVVELCDRLAEAQGYAGLDSETIALGFNSMIDGFWTGAAIEQRDFNRGAAIQACMRYFAGFFPAEFAALAEESEQSRRRTGRIGANSLRTA